MHDLLDHKARLLSGEEIELSRFRGEVLLVVNTASRCGFTPQYGGLQALQAEYGAQGFSVLAFPCNQFGSQEPGTAEGIGAFCDLRWRVAFPVFDKVDVNGPEAHPLFRDLTRARRGLFGTGSIKWNFTKFLIDREGSVVARFAPFTRPERLRARIEKLLRE